MNFEHNTLSCMFLCLAVLAKTKMLEIIRGITTNNEPSEIEVSHNPLTKQSVIALSMDYD